MPIELNRGEVANLGDISPGDVIYLKGDGQPFTVTLPSADAPFQINLDSVVGMVRTFSNALDKPLSVWLRGQRFDLPPGKYLLIDECGNAHVLPEYTFDPPKRTYQLQPKTSAARCVAVGATIGNILGFSTDVFLAHEPWPRIERIGTAALSFSLIAYAVARLIDWRNGHRRQNA